MASASNSSKTEAMGEKGTAPEGSATKPIATEELGPLWDAWRAGKTVPCPRDRGPMALAVDAGAQAYRLVCVRCGNASLWFETAPSGIQVRTGTSSFPAPRPGMTDD
jgi:hypothetical protein